MGERRDGGQEVWQLAGGMALGGAQQWEGGCRGNWL